MGISQLKGDSLEEFRLAVRKVKLSMFDGNDPRGWITYAETYFSVQQTSPQVKVSLAQICMEGNCLHWFTILLEAKPALTWENLKEELLLRYSGRQT